MASELKAQAKQTGLAQVAGASGLSLAALSAWADGRRELRPEALRLLEATLRETTGN